MDNISRYTKEEMATLIKNFGEVFEVARLVDVSLTKQYELTEDQCDFRKTEYSCYAIWNNHRRCENCVSAKAYAKRSKMTKFEFVDNDVYYVVAKYVEMDGVPYMLELVTKIDDDTLFGAYGKEEFIDTITSYNKKLYVDTLTNAYNRNYYNDQLLGLSKVSGIAMMDIDKFKDVNDTYGHDAGDEVLKCLVHSVQGCLRSTDAVIRYGGDEFIVIFKETSREMFGSILERIRSTVENMKIDKYPEISTSISIGGYYCQDEEGLGALKSADELLYEAKKNRNKVVFK